ncbi:MAG: CCA tRNA nucleotidyltransferase [Sphingomonadaceae bacterium]
MNPPRTLSVDHWMARPGVPALLSTLDAEDGATRLVGGAVRDWLLGLDVADVDFATRLAPEEVLERLEKARIKAIPTGIRHGTITAVTHGAPYEITTLRHDVETFGRHANVAFTNDWRADAARRDFTINALYADPLTGELYDWFGGHEDLATRTVRFIGEPLQRIAEDHLRILRFFRFSARFGTGLEPEGFAACVARAADLMALSRERIREELRRLLALPAPVATVRAMVEYGILRPVLPEITLEGVDRMAATIAAEAAAGARGDALRRLAALVPGESADAIAVRLKLSNADRARLVAATGPGERPDDMRVLAYRIGAPAAFDRMLISGDSRAGQWRGPFANWQRPRMPLTGKDIIAMGVPPGPEVSKLLAEIENCWLAAGLPADRERTAALARKVLGRR